MNHIRPPAPTVGVPEPNMPFFGQRGGMDRGNGSVATPSLGKTPPLDPRLPQSASQMPRDENGKINWLAAFAPLLGIAGIAAGTSNRTIKGIPVGKVGQAVATAAGGFLTGYAKGKALRYERDLRERDFTESKARSVRDDIRAYLNQFNPDAAEALAHSSRGLLGEQFYEGVLKSITDTRERIIESDDEKTATREDAEWGRAKSLLTTEALKEKSNFSAISGEVREGLSEFYQEMFDTTVSAIQDSKHAEMRKSLSAVNSLTKFRIWKFNNYPKIKDPDFKAIVDEHGAYVAGLHKAKERESDLERMRTEGALIAQYLGFGDDANYEKAARMVLKDQLSDKPLSAEDQKIEDKMIQDYVEERKQIPKSDLLRRSMSSWMTSIFPLLQEDERDQHMDTWMLKWEEYYRKSGVSGIDRGASKEIALAVTAWKSEADKGLLFPSDFPEYEKKLQLRIGDDSGMSIEVYNKVMETARSRFNSILAETQSASVEEIREADEFFKEFDLDEG